ncbi:proteasome assembly chaperone family protein [Candidatus Woesearchaeota archaeon]|nr:proteasome assembly chaperone family protein [Candidatus Woesearchaeota archaeon]
MKPVKLTKKIKNATIIAGFPGYGLVGSISTEFLTNHLKCELIGKVWFDEIPATLVLHNQKIVYPIGIFYNKQYNLVIVHSITAIPGIEWQSAAVVASIASQVKAKEIITLEGVGTSNPVEENLRVFSYTNTKKAEEKLKKISVDGLREGIIVGVTSALMLQFEKIPLTAIFAESQTTIPDSKAAARIIETLDKYLGLKVDYKPLLQSANEFEKKLRGFVDQSTKAQKVQEEKQMSYVG